MFLTYTTKEELAKKELLGEPGFFISFMSESILLSRETPRFKKLSERHKKGLDK